MSQLAMFDETGCLFTSIYGCHFRVCLKMAGSSHFRHVQALQWLQGAQWQHLDLRDGGDQLGSSLRELHVFIFHNLHGIRRVKKKEQTRVKVDQIANLIKCTRFDSSTIVGIYHVFDNLHGV